MRVLVGKQDMSPAAVMGNDVQGSIGANGFAHKGYFSAAVTGTKVHLNQSQIHTTILSFESLQQETFTCRLEDFRQLV